MSAEERIAVERHPRARHSIARAKGIGGIACFALVGVLSLRAGVPFFDSGVRALVGGVAGYAFAWFAAVNVWRHVTIAEIRRHQAAMLERRRLVQEEIESIRTAGRAEAS